MPLAIKWSYFNKDNVTREKDNFGVYELGNDDDILYIGEGQVYTRLMSHFPNSREPVVGASYYRVEYTGGKQRAIQRQNAELEAYKRKNGRHPKFNYRKS
jgi:hypothetical protein